MKLGLIDSSTTLGILGASLAATFAMGACSSANTAGGSLFNGGGDGGASSSSSSGATSSGSSPSPSDPPHALGVVSLAESHYSGASTSTPYLSASFVPDAALATACSTTIAGCSVPMVPTCDGKAGPLCGTEQTCSLDSSCNATCVTPCTAECPVGEECYFASNSSQSCRAVQSFNAGALAFAGTTEPITLYPPYAFDSTADGSLFLAGAALEVQGAGVASGAGFGAFDQKFTATTFLQTSPSLSTLSASDVWGTGSIPVGWVPGTDSIVVSISGSLGSAQCQAADATGHFDVPRAVVNALVGTGTPTLTVSVTRQRQDWNKSLKTQGTLTAETVQPLAFLEVETSSTESFSFEGCAGGGTMCTEGCVDLTNSDTNCGSCGHVCPSGDYCSNGTCYGTTQNCGSLSSCSDGCVNLQTSLSDCGFCGNACPSGDSCISGQCTGSSTTTCSSCTVTAEEGTCATAYANCANDTNCQSYITCVQNCGTSNSSCVSSCQIEYSASTSEAETLQTCICQTACSSSCATDTSCTIAL